MATITPTPALKCLQEMRDEVMEKEKSGERTLSFWRFSDPDIWKAMVDFASAPDWSYNGASDEEACLQEVQTLFTWMNQAMVKQERSLLWPDADEPIPNQNQWSVVFGGKFAVVACSIAEQLVELLASASDDARVYTVSRTPTPKDATMAPPSNVTHFPKQNLENKGGAVEFEEVINRVVDDWEAANPSNGSSEPEGKIPIVFYFTLGKHKGDNFPFRRNIQAANSFVEALRNIVPSRLIAKGIPWRIVITGTDATCPSTKEDLTLTVKDFPTTVPTYKIVPYNSVYAASKLCQFYSIATAVADMTKAPVIPPLDTSREGNDGSLASITKQLTDFVVDGLANGTYQPNDIMTDKELDQISNYWTQVVEVALEDYLQTAKSISICYTPLHRDPWTHWCLTDKSKESPKKFMIQNIVWRLKNAISIDKAARAHL